MKQPWLTILIAATVITLVFIVIELLIIGFNGTPVAAPAIPRDPVQFGTGPKLKYVIMGDSTAIGQGTDYESSFALASARHLAKSHTVNFVNVGISGAATKGVQKDQLNTAISYEPDLVLLAVGANDATHFHNGGAIQAALQAIIDGLRAANCNVRIVVTRSPAMDSVTRFPWPVKQLMGLRTSQVNKAFEPLIAKNGLTLAPIAEKTREPFLKDPSLLSKDKFHPNDRGYALWIPVVNEALDKALQESVPKDCAKPGS